MTYPSKSIKSNFPYFLTRFCSCWGPCWLWWKRSAKKSLSWNMKIMVFSFIKNRWSNSKSSMGVGKWSISWIWSKSWQLGKLNTKRVNFSVRHKATALLDNLCRWADSLVCGWDLRYLRCGLKKSKIIVSICNDREIDKFREL